MSIISSASGSSCWRGLDYYKKEKVKNISQITEYEFKSDVIGTEEYNVYLNLKKPRTSKCNCPLANGKMIICKHIVATYFAVVPNSAEDFEEEQKQLQEEYTDYKEEQYLKVIKYIKKMTKKELVDELIWLLDYAPEWVYEHFVFENEIDKLD